MNMKTNTCQYQNLHVIPKPAVNSVNSLALNTSTSLRLEYYLSLTDKVLGK